MEITLQEAKIFYPQLNDKGKKMLAEKFGADQFEHNYKFIKTFEDACKHQRVKPEDVAPYKDPQTADQVSMNAYAKLIIIARAINDNIEPDWDNSDEYKWCPYFDMRGSGLGFSGTAYGGWSAGTDVGSRLCYKSKEQAIYAGETFLDIYKEFMK